MIQYNVDEKNRKESEAMSCCHEEQAFVCREDYPIAETRAGKLRGYQVGSTFCFLGVTYARAKRFMMPEPVEAWEGVVDAHAAGPVCPLLDDENPWGDVMIPHRFWPKSEDCLSLNLWTQSLDRNAKKPVMVWFHGGGYSTGSAVEMVAYDGDKLSEFGDVVVVTVNHRLNILGYFDLSEYGGKYANSGNLGQADLVEALRWVHENIAAFGGDPDNVTIFGQSGGGGKVNAMLNTPAAKGLFHKGILMSGVGGRRPAAPKTSKKPLVEALLKELGEADVSALETVPFEKLRMAYRAVSPGLQAQGVMGWWAPTPNDWYLGDPYDVGFLDWAKDIPVMVGSVIAEWGFGPGVLGRDRMSEGEKRAIVAKQFGEEEADRLIAAFRAAWPDKDETELLSLSNRLGTLEYCAYHAENCRAKTWNYLFAYTFTYDGGKPAWHCSDIPYAFHNTLRVPICWEPGVREKLEADVAGSYVAFARYGDPNHPGMDGWAPFTAEKPVTMYWDKESKASDKDLKLQHIHEKVAPKGPF